MNDKDKARSADRPPTQLIGDSETMLNTAPASAELCAGTVLRDRFVLEAEIGRGGMGIVYRARDLRREEAHDRKKYVAIKVLGQELKHNPQAMIGLQREARRAQQLAHPNIATVYDFDREGEVAYLCMELLKGRGLRLIMRESESRGLPLEEAMPIIEGMAGGLAYAHQRGIVHADFKPGNIFVKDDGTVKILDFGIARVVRRSDQTTETRFDPGDWGALTPSYASCEMFRRLDPDPRDDVYGLACVSYELLAGRHPFDRVSSAQARANGMTPDPVPGLTRRQNQALRRGLAFLRQDRTPSAREFLDELSPANRKELSRNMLGLAAVSVVSLGVAIAIAVWLRFDDSGAESEPAATAELMTRQEPSEVITNNVTPETVEPEPIDAKTQARIENILEVAGLHLAMDRLVQPPGSNAAEAYATVSELQPGNPTAQQGLEEIGVRIRQKAQALVDQGNRAEAIELVERGLEWAPRQPELVRLHQELRR
ncbi:MAG: protein kinase [Gammaproteobacteria bacterium]|nr:protein kinase [Gammaproteobacteria bacterium]